MTLELKEQSTILCLMFESCRKREVTVVQCWSVACHGMKGSKMDYGSNVDLAVLVCYRRIMAMRRKARQSVNHLHEDSYTLGFFLQCNMDSESPSWTCHAHAKMRLVPWKEGATPTERRNYVFLFYKKSFVCYFIVQFIY